MYIVLLMLKDLFDSWTAFLSKLNVFMSVCGLTITVPPFTKALVEWLDFECDALYLDPGEGVAMCIIQRHCSYVMCDMAVYS